CSSASSSAFSDSRWWQSKSELRSGLQVLPTSNFTGVAILTGVGFTMSLFIGTLAFEDESLMAQVRLGVLVASILSGLVASLVLVAAARVHASDATTRA